MKTCPHCGRMMPRFFKHRDGFSNDALYVRVDGPNSVLVVTREGKERPPKLAGWNLEWILSMVESGVSIEITELEAAAMLTAERRKGK